MIKKIRPLFFGLAVTLLLGWLAAPPTAQAVPEVWSIEILDGVTVANNSIVGIVNTATEGEMLIEAGDSDVVAYEAGGSPSPVPLYDGTISDYGQCYSQVLVCNSEIAAEERAAIGRAAAPLGYPTNHNPDLFPDQSEVDEGNQGPMQTQYLQLDEAGLPPGTQIRFTIVDTEETPPPAHLIVVMGGSTPTVNYTTIEEIPALTITTTTTATTNENGETFDSTVGFMIFTDTAEYGETPLRIIAQTDHWLGDLYPLLPEVDTEAAQGGGTLGDLSARCGLTAYGPSGGQRSASIFVPDAIVTQMYGDITTAALAPFANNTLVGSSTVITGQNNFDTTGSRASFNYTFPSVEDPAEDTPVDAAMGASTDIDSDGDGVLDSQDTAPNDNAVASPQAVTGTGAIVIDINDSANPSGISLSEVQTISDTDPSLGQSGKPAGADFAHGLVSFKVNNVPKGDTVTIEITFPGAVDSDDLIYKADAEGFRLLLDYEIEGPNTISYSLTDGGPNDTDGSANRVIVDPVGLTGYSGTTSLSSGNGCFLNTLTNGQQP